jgi:hypothetical protein
MDNMRNSPDTPNLVDFYFFNNPFQSGTTNSESSESHVEDRSKEDTPEGGLEEAKRLKSDSE